MTPTSTREPVSSGPINMVIGILHEVPDRKTERVEHRCIRDLDFLYRVTIEGLRHAHAILLLELGDYPEVV